VSSCLYSGPFTRADGEFDLPEAARKAIRALSSNHKGYFLMIEWDAHTDDPQRGLRNLAGFDKLIKEIARTVNRNDTLLLFTADHSFDLRMHGGLKTDPVLKGFEEWKQQHKREEPIELPVLRVRDDHTGEEVLAAAMGPGSDRVKGFFPNTFLFQVIMDAWGWKPDR